MKKIGVVSYNIHCNFTNYGSALQSYALCEYIKHLGYDAYLIDYLPDILADCDVLNPYKKTWDKNDKFYSDVNNSLVDIKINNQKFVDFYSKRFKKTECFRSSNFNDSKTIVDSYVCGSDTIFCIDEFGFDDGYYANYDCMKQNAISYAASFGDSHFDDTTIKELEVKIKNFKALGIRENRFIDLIKKYINVPIKNVLDPTLLFDKDFYDLICAPKQYEFKYLFYYSRRYNATMEKFTNDFAKKHNLIVVDISLQQSNALLGHVMRYDAGVEEFLSLIKYADYIVTNSYHGMIFAIQYEKPFTIFSREQCDNKISELLAKLSLSNRLFNGSDNLLDVDYSSIKKKISILREESSNFLKESLKVL